MKVSYLSHAYNSETPSYGNRDQVLIIPKNSISNGDTANTNDLRFTNNHIGTHIDVPKHFYDTGSTITDVDPGDWFFDEVEIVDIPCDEARLLDVDDFDAFEINMDLELLIIRTGFESFRNQEKYWNAYPGISEKACEYLRAKYKKLRAVGFDFISLTSPLFKEQGVKAHLSFLNEKDGRPIWIIEDMKIDHLVDSPEKVIVSPLLIEESNGGAVTIFAIE